MISDVIKSMRIMLLSCVGRFIADSNTDYYQKFSEISYHIIIRNSTHRVYNEWLLQKRNVIDKINVNDVYPTNFLYMSDLYSYIAIIQ